MTNGAGAGPLARRSNSVDRSRGAKMPDKETRTVPLGLRITPTLKAAIDKAAADNERSVASYIERVVFEHLRKKGYLPKT